ncbi:MAG: F0F1 ATP synthase subunit A [Proteobacteria bacterium]|nr:F0F1 ATP synthase subunit A [Pseudomonadota bacterium]
MEEFLHAPKWILTLFGHEVVLNADTIIHTLVVMGLLILFALVSTRKMSFLPGRFQTIAELIVVAFENLVHDALDGRNRKYFPLILVLFLFLVLSNWLGLVPGLGEPTRDLNTPLSLGIMGFFIAHYAGIRTKGLKGYLAQYVEPMFFMAPLNVISEVAKVVSISFRLYGNIMGGAIIIAVVSDLVFSLLLPPFLNAFFGLFVGTVQAFVFTMLTTVYISVQTK